MPRLVKASVHDAKALTGLTMISKKHWGYTAAQIQKWESELTITAYYLNNFNVYKLLEEDLLVGYYSWCGKPPLALLDNLFVHPDHLKKGYGKLLMENAVKQLGVYNFKKIRLNSDPNAEGFYLKLGFNRIGELESTIPGRFLPIMEMEI